MRAQRLAAPVVIYVEPGSAHPLEDEAATGGMIDGFLNSDGEFSPTQSTDFVKPVLRLELDPDDGLYMLPYQRSWMPALAGEIDARDLTYYPDAQRLFEEIDRFGLDDFGNAQLLSRQADYQHYRAAPSGGYPYSFGEQPGVDFFPYRPQSIAASPSSRDLVEITNIVSSALEDPLIDGLLWLEGSPAIEETLYWFQLVLSTHKPICGTSAQRPHGTVSADGDRNVIDAVTYLCSDIWRDSQGANKLGAVLVVDGLVYSARDVRKVDGRPGGYAGAGGLDGAIASIGLARPNYVATVPHFCHTATSRVSLSDSSTSVPRVGWSGSRDGAPCVRTTDEKGRLLPDAMPVVECLQFLRYAPWNDTESRQYFESLALRLDYLRAHAPLAGIVLEGNAPFGRTDQVMTEALVRASLSGIPVVCVGRGGAAVTPPQSQWSFVSGSNLSGTKARMLLMAFLLKYGAPPSAADPSCVTGDEREAIERYTKALQETFDTH